ncbi:GNAT family N-acetyltransferase [Nonomuraea rhizosphaerae]|uniref:GNAT family N-acetyltransferase n=1 Tax=Nonomuraea rhizosphaerae TaxID=2665663 RepID=UPI001C5E9323|nr:GNAT family N-acetyltransferase [Nonomuraea rhizosphaerae]
MTYPIRPVDEAEWPQFADVLSEGFGWTPHPTQLERAKLQTEFDRTLAAFDGDVMAGVTAVFTFLMTVPGAQIPVAGVTAVSVLASHRRRGVLSALMRRQLSDVRDRGESVAALYASESVIYSRFGYGRAASEMGFSIAKSGSAFVGNAPADPSLRLRVVKPAEASGEFERLFASVVAARPGRYARGEHFWSAWLADEEFDREGYGQLRGLIAEDEGGVRGYALFRIKARWDDDGVPSGVLKLHEVEAADPAAYALLWRSMLDRDLVARVEGARPVDDPILALLADPRQLRSSVTDELWVRLVEVDKALTSRAYVSPVDVVIEVEDDVCPWNARRWRLSADASGSECKPVDDEPDLSLTASSLGSAYMGDSTVLTAQRDAGLLREHTPGSVRGLATAMSWSPKPWSGMTF